MEREWQGILSRYGQNVTLYRGEKRAAVRAFLQPVLEKGTVQELPTPLGLGVQDRVLYLGPADHPLDSETLVVWGEREYRVQSTHLVGEGICPYQWAVLYPRDEVEA